MISKVTLENYMKYFLLENNKKFSKNTSITYKINLNQYLNFYDDKYNDLENLIHYKMHLEECYKPVTVKNKLRILHVYYAYLEKKKFVDISPFKQTMFELPAEETKMRVLTEETLKILEDYMIKKMHTKNHYHRKLIIRNYAIIEIILITGIRLSELCCLKKTDINFDREQICITHNKKKRVLPLDSKCVFLIRSYLDVEENNTSYLFSSRNKKLSERSVEFFLENISNELDTDEKITPNILRNTHIYYLLKNEKNLIMVKNRLNISISTVYRYYERLKNL